MSWTLSTLKCSDQKDPQYTTGYPCPSSYPLVRAALHRLLGVWLVLHCPPVGRIAPTSGCLLFSRETCSLCLGVRWALAQLAGEDEPSSRAAVNTGGSVQQEQSPSYRAGSPNVRVPFAGDRRLKPASPATGMQNSWGVCCDI